MRGAARVVGTLGAIIIALTLASGAPAAALGPQRVLTVLVTFDGAHPFTRAAVTDVMGQAGSFFRRSSFGHLWLVPTVTPWLEGGPVLPSCALSSDRLFAPLRAVTQTGGYRTADYDRIIYVVSGPDCGFHGIEFGNEVMIVRQPDAGLIVHELGHTFGLPHAGASASVCATYCTIQEQGDLYSPMGTGFVDFGAYEKEQLGWIPRQPRVTQPGHYLVYPRSGGIGHQALVIDAPEGEYWLEQRPGGSAPALIVRVVQPETNAPGYIAASTLLLAPIRVGHPMITPGQTFRVPGEFSVTVAHGTTAPLRLNLRVPAGLR